MKNIVIGFVFSLVLFATIACGGSGCGICGNTPGQLVSVLLPDKSQTTMYADDDGCVHVEIGSNQSCDDFKVTGR